MIPYFVLEKIMLGPVTIHVWGIFVSLGIAAAVSFAYFLARGNSLSLPTIMDSAIWILIGAFLGARLFHVFFYEPAYFAAHPLDIIKIWQGGASSTGGFMGAGIGLYLFAKFKKMSFKNLLPYFDVLAVALWLGWGIGRLGCFLTHLHPGRRTDFFLGVAYPGGTRFDLGLMESLVGFILFAIFVFLFKRLSQKQSGLVAVYSVAVYAVIRFFLDFLRVSAREYSGADARYWFLTPAQWSTLLFLAALIWAGNKLGRQKMFKKNV